MYLKGVTIPPSRTANRQVIIFINKAENIIKMKVIEQKIMYNRVINMSISATTISKT